MKVKITARDDEVKDLLRGVRDYTVENGDYMLDIPGDPDACLRFIQALGRVRVLARDADGMLTLQFENDYD